MASVTGTIAVSVTPAPSRVEGTITVNVTPAFVPSHTSGVIPITVQPALSTITGSIDVTVSPPHLWMRKGDTLVPVRLAQRQGSGLVLL